MVDFSLTDEQQALREMGYTHCFLVSGGNAMHLLDAVRSQMTCIPVVHEVSAGIAVEYFNEVSDVGKAFAIVTAGPGLTNIVTALAGAFLESRELLLLGGQVKTTDLADPGMRQRGIQEIAGRDIAEPVCVAAVQLTAPISRQEFMEIVERGYRDRPGPVFVEVCLDVQGAPVNPADLNHPKGSADDFLPRSSYRLEPSVAAAVIDAQMAKAKRPAWLIGGGVSRDAARAVLPELRRRGVPVLTTWNGIDRVPADEPMFFGRPNTWGQRSANLIMQQTDQLIVFGSRLGLQQTGFNWQEFAPVAEVTQVEIDEVELTKGHPHVEHPLLADANAVLPLACNGPVGDISEWVAFCRRVTELLPLDDPENETGEGFIAPYQFVLALSDLCTSDDVVIPCSSGGANTVMQQAFLPKAGQSVLNSKGLASMGYGLGAALGAACAHRDRRTVLVEGDGGFAQNLQDLATVAVNDLNMKIFIFANDGYASIRTTQRNYFDGAYLGCDERSGLGMPDWPTLFHAFGIPAIRLPLAWDDDPEFLEAWNATGPFAFVVPIDPEQTYYPKISSRVRPDGGMESNPLHMMSPDLPEDVAAEVMRYLL
ncbi:MAG: thiamine pyrophosphate-dependent enzyme [Thermoleophilia bacterium]